MSFLLSWLKPLAYISVPIVILKTLATPSRPKLRYWVHLSTYVACLGVVASWAVVIAITFNLVGQRANVNWMVARTFYWVTTTVLDLTVEIEGAEHLENSPVVFMSNHQSMLDVFLLGSVFPKRTSMMAKKELQKGPLGPFMTMSSAVFVDRGNNVKAIQSLQAAGESMKANNTSLWMYPEGTRHLSEVPDLLPFKKGGFHVAVQCGIPIVPIVAENYWRVYHKGIFGAGVLKVRVLPPIPTAHLKAEDVSELAASVREAMLDALRDISVKVSGSTPIKKELEPVPAPAEITPALDVKVPGSSLDIGIPAPLFVNSNTTASSSESGSSSGPSSAGHRAEGSETEEDEGMVLVGRPQ